MWDSSLSPFDPTTYSIIKWGMDFLARGYKISFTIRMNRHNLEKISTWSLSSVRFNYKPDYKPRELL